MSPLAVASLLAVSGEAKKSGPIGLAVILLLCVACYFLFKSMSRHLRKVREDFPPADGTAADGTPDAPDAAADQPPATPATPGASDGAPADQPDQPPSPAG